jgi:hypothetical protein
MSTSDVSMREIELEGAELLPTRETLCCWGSQHSGPSFTAVFAQGGSTTQYGIGNVAVLDGNAVNIIL